MSSRLARCVSYVIIRQYMITATISIALPRLELGSSACFIFAAEIRVRGLHAYIDGLAFCLMIRKVPYERWLCPIVAAHRPAEGESFPTSLPEFVLISLPYDHLYFNSNLLHWAKEVHLEFWNRSGDRHRYISGCQNAALFALPPSMRFEYHAQIWANWQDEFECYPILTVPTPMVFA